MTRGFPAHVTIIYLLALDFVVSLIFHDGRDLPVFYNRYDKGYVTFATQFYTLLSKAFGKGNIW